MTVQGHGAVLLDRQNIDSSFIEKAHVHVDHFRARDEAETAFTLFPERARSLEAQGLLSRSEHGGIVKAPGLVTVQVDLLDFLSQGEAMLDLLGPLAVPHITSDMMKALGADPFADVDWEGNLLCNAGINGVLGNRLVGGTATAYTAAATAIGAGDTSTAAAATQTDLSAAVNAANRWIQLVDSAPTFATQVMTAVATFATGNGNFAWAEWIISQNASSAAAAATASVLNRKVASLGTKTSAAAWAFTVTLTFS